MRQSSETLAGRVAYVDMAPIDTREAAQAGIDDATLWLRGGFPDSLLAADDRRSLDWRRDFIRSYLERDVPMFAPRLPAETIGRLWTMLAHQQGGVLNQARIAAALGVTNPTVDRYIDLLVDLQLVRRLRPWSGNVGKRLVKSPKVYVRDSGVLHGLLALRTLDDLLGHPVSGLSYEGHCIDSLVQAAGPDWVPYFYRTHVGAEIDLLLEQGGRSEIAIEIKRSTAPSPERGFATASDDLGVAQRDVVYPGTERFPLRNGAQASGQSAGHGCGQSASHSTDVQIDLPDALAQQARQAGLLSTTKMEPMLRAQLRREALSALRLLEQAVEDEIELFSSPALLAELRNTLLYPKFIKRLNALQTDVDTLVRSYEVVTRLTVSQADPCAYA